MCFILKLRQFLLFLSILMFLLIAGTVNAQDGNYAFFANTWKGEGGGKDYRSSDMVYYLVSVPDGNRARQPGPMYYIAPDGQHTIVDGTFKGREGSLLNIWDGTVQTFHFDQSVYVPHIWSPDSQYIATGVVTRKCDTCTRAYPMDLGIVDAATGDLRVLTDGAYIEWMWSGHIAWSPDGRFLAYIDTRYNDSAGQIAETLKVVPIDGSQPPRILHTFRSGGDSLRPFIRWTPDGKRIVVHGNTGSLRENWFIDVSTGEISYYDRSAEYSDMCWSSTTDHFVRGLDWGFELITPDFASPLDTSFVDPSIWKLRPGSNTPCEWSPDGNKLILIYSRGYPNAPGIKVIDFAARQVFDILIEGSYGLLHPYWSSDSRMLALKTYTTSRDPNDVFIYDMTTLQLALVRKNLDFIAWVPIP